MADATTDMCGLTWEKNPRQGSIITTLQLQFPVTMLSYGNGWTDKRKNAKPI